jgi:hypothetical protein
MAADPDIQRRQHAERVQRYRERLKAGLVGARLLADPNDEGAPPHCYESLPDAPPHCYESPPEYGVSGPPDERELSDMRRRESERVKAYRARRLALDPEGTRELERERQRYYRAKQRTEAAAASVL